MNEQVYALSLDVIFDTSEENFQSAFKGAKLLWPGFLQAPRWQEIPPWLTKKLLKIRPVIENEFDNILLVRMLVEEQRIGETSRRGTRPLTVGEVTANWDELRFVLMAKYRVTDNDLMRSFYQSRDIWVDSNLEEWLLANRIYPGLSEAINNASHPIYLVTCTPVKYVELILEAFGINKKLYTPYIVKCWKMLVELPELKHKLINYVERNYKLLNSLSSERNGSDRLNLLFAEWGSTTDRIRAVVAHHPKIRTLSLMEFVLKID